MACLGRLGQAKLPGRDRFDPEGGQQFAHFTQLAGIVGRDHNLADQRAMHSGHSQGRHGRTLPQAATVFFCRSTS